MKPDDIIKSVGHIDDDLIERAEKHAANSNVLRFPKQIVATAACLALVLISGFTAYATGAFDGILAYFGGSTEPYMSEVMSAVAAVSNDELVLRIDGAIADEHSCHMVVSFVRLTSEYKERFLAGSLEEQARYNLKAITKSGEIVYFPSRETSTYTEETADGPRKAITMFDDADMTFLVSCYVGEDSSFTMNDLDSILFEYEGLTLELDTENIVAPEQQLVPENPSASTVTNFYISRISFCFTMAIPENGVGSFDLWLIKNDGTLWKEGHDNLGFSATGMYSDDNTEITWIGYWGGDSVVSVGLIDLEDFCGAQINGENYYFK